MMYAHMHQNMGVDLGNVWLSTLTLGIAVYK